MKLLKSDVADYSVQQKGVVVNVNAQKYQEYLKAREILEKKNSEIDNLKSRINTIEQLLTELLERK